MLYKEYALLQSCYIRKLPCGLVELVIHAQKPLCVCNKDVVITQSHSLVPINWYRATAVANLPQMQSSMPLHNLSYQDRAQLTQFITDVSLHYSVTFIDKYHIDLQSKQLQSCRVRCSFDALPSAVVLAQCEQMFQEIIKNNPHYTTHKRYLADIRFERQIVVRQLGGGEDHGKRIVT
jgi:hypothetical protein